MIRRLRGFAGLLFAVVGLVCCCPCDGAIARRVIKADGAGANLLKSDGWRAWQAGFSRSGDLFVCDNGDDEQVQRGASQTVVLNQTVAAPIVASVFSKAEGVTGGKNTDYSLYLDLVYADGTPLWGQTAVFGGGTHDWRRGEVVVMPEKPVKSVTVNMLFRRHGGKVWFKEPKLSVMKHPEGACVFDGVAVSLERGLREGFMIRDVGAGSDFVEISKKGALGIKLECEKQTRGGVTFFDVTIADTTGRDRAVSLVYTMPLGEGDWRWLVDPRRSVAVGGRGEYMNTSNFKAGASGRLSKYPLGAVADASRGAALGIDMGRPAFYRIGFNGQTRELFIVYDIGLAREKPSAKVRFCTYDFAPEWEFRSALAKYYEIFSEQFDCRIKVQGLWMPFAKISEVKGWEDFGFAVKEGNNETKWDDEHGIVTFRYTEPMTWWMRMAKEKSRTLESALAYARQLAQGGDAKAKAFLSSGYHDEEGQFTARLLDTPWCDGAVWSMNSMPGIEGEFTDFKSKWNAGIREKYYGAKRTADLDGEYIDSSEGYVTEEIDFRRDHFGAARTPLTFSRGDHKVGIFRGLIVFEYTRAMADDVHGMGKYMMANSTPSRLCWLAPMLDVMGTETNWNPGGKWRPMSDAQMLYKRVMCKGKPFCFLMNSEFEKFSHELVEKYMKRSLAYGMFPGFFSHNASQGHYFRRPELYERDRELFKKYVPLCKLVAEAGWAPVTNARSNDENVYVERFGEKYLTVFNHSMERLTVSIKLEENSSTFCRELLGGKRIRISNSELALTLGAEDVAVIALE